MMLTHDVSDIKDGFLIINDGIYVDNILISCDWVWIERPECYVTREINCKLIRVDKEIKRRVM